MKSKTILEQGADAFMSALVKSAAKGVEVVAREVGKNVSTLIHDAAMKLEKEASCTCHPGEARTTAEDGTVEIEVVHAKGCPAR